MIDFAGAELDAADEALLARPEVGGVILFARNYVDRRHLEFLVKSVRAVRPDILIAVDQEGGRVQRFKQDFHVLPALGRLGEQVAGGDVQAVTEMARLLAWLMAAELISVGIDISFAPVLDLDKARSQVIGDRAFGDDPHLVTTLGRAYIQGMHLAGMAATGKHFPGHGGVVEDSHLELPVDNRSLDEIWDKDLLPFRRLSADLDAVMAAHIQFPRVDEAPVGFSGQWLQEILKLRMQFKGRVFSDDLNMEGAALTNSFAERARMALEAGCDMLLVCNNRDAATEVADWLADQKQLTRLDWHSMRSKRTWSEDSISDHPWYDESISVLEQLT